MNTGLPGYSNKGIPVPRVLCHSLTEVTEVTGKGIRTYRSSGYWYGSVSLHNSQKFRVLWLGRTELTEVPGSYKNAVPVTSSCPGYLWHWRTQRIEVPGTGTNVLQNLQKFFVG